jgi:hypothetical protein
VEAQSSEMVLVCSLPQAMTHLIMAARQSSPKAMEEIANLLEHRHTVLKIDHDRAQSLRVKAEGPIVSSSNDRMLCFLIVALWSFTHNSARHANQTTS